MKKKLPDYNFVSIQECQFDMMMEEINFKEIMVEVNQDIATTFIPPRSFYFGGKKENFYTIYFLFFQQYFLIF